MAAPLHELADRLRPSTPATKVLQAARAQGNQALQAGLSWPNPKIDHLTGPAIDAVQGHLWQALSAQAVSEAALAEAREQLAAVPGFAAQLVFVDGQPAPGLSRLPSQAGVTLQAIGGPAASGPSSDAHLAIGALKLHTDEAYAALNTALMGHAATLHVASNTRVPAPVGIVFITTSHADGALVQPRSLVTAGTHSEVVVIERHLGPAHSSAWNNAVTEVIADVGAHVHLLIEQQSNDVSFHMGTVGLKVARDAHCELTTFDAGARLCRRSLRADLSAPGARSSMWHVAMARGSNHAATYATTRHLAGHTNSQQVFRAVADRGGQGAFSGTVHIVKDAPQANAEQMSRGLLLSPSSKISLRPQLMISTDDVKCAHGATVGALDADAAFYLTSRGIPADKAQELLTFAFLGDALAGVPTSVRPHLEAQIARWLGSDELPMAGRGLLKEDA